jgi:carboxypeptidase family protein
MSVPLNRVGSSRLFFGLGLTLGLLVCLSATPAWSQATSTSTVTGLVTDQQSSAITGAEVRLTDTGTGSALSTTTNDTGRYVFVNVSPGSYTIRSPSRASRYTKSRRRRWTSARWPP